MNTQAAFSLRGRNPDALTCIANLSNAEVFTPPEFANRMLDTVAAGKVRAKTGTMSGVSALSGYVTAADDDPLVFSILIQNFAGSARPAQELQDAICVLLSGYQAM